MTRQCISYRLLSESWYSCLRLGRSTILLLELDVRRFHVRPQHIALFRTSFPKSTFPSNEGDEEVGKDGNGSVEHRDSVNIAYKTPLIYGNAQPSVLSRYALRVAGGPHVCQGDAPAGAIAGRPAPLGGATPAPRGRMRLRCVFLLQLPEHVSSPQVPFVGIVGLEHVHGLGLGARRQSVHPTQPQDLARVVSQASVLARKYGTLVAVLASTKDNDGRGRICAGVLVSKVKRSCEFATACPTSSARVRETFSRRMRAADRNSVPLATLRSLSNVCPRFVGYSLVDAKRRAEVRGSRIVVRRRTSSRRESKRTCWVFKDASFAGCVTTSFTLCADSVAFRSCRACLQVVAVGCAKLERWLQCCESA